MSIYIGDKEIKNLYAGGSIIVSDMQGPCPDGFHVPLRSEWTALYNVGVSLGAWTSSGGNDMKTYLKLPMAGYRSSYNAAMDNVGTAARYWSSSYYDTDNVYVLVCYSSGEIYPQTTNYRACGYSIRGFKNTPVEPTSSRTKLYGTSIESGGIFWSSTDGLISLSSDGQTWITIADKNVGATTVYNSGDTLSEANCGKQYQRGNNYGFPVTGTVTTSLNMVNAADYGPGNYYSSSTFIKRTSSPYGQWDSSSNNNLRGGVTQGTTEKPKEAKAVYLGDTLVRPGIVNFATQGPCPDGFHVPTKSDAEQLMSIMSGLSLTTSDNWRIYLKIPKAGSVNYRTGKFGGSGGGELLWTATYNSGQAYEFAPSSSPTTMYIVPTAQGGSVRSFSNENVNPISSGSTLKSGWTWLYHSGSNAYGIAHNSSDGIISLSSNGTTWLTIADKNVGATTAYSDGATLSEANCGKLFQRGNNYGFTRGVNPSPVRDAQVDASAYGPGNYYSSSTWLTRYYSPYQWDSSGKANLRGGVDGNVPVS